MAPNLLGSSLFLAEATAAADSIETLNKSHPVPQAPQAPQVRPHNKPQTQEPQYKWDIVWRNVLGMIYLHIYGVYGMYLFLFVCQWKTFIWGLLVALMAGQAITAGAHRLWAHRSYKANTPLRIFLAFWQTVAFQNDIFEWVRDHRVHHKFTDTDADPHNAKRGFFFSHVGWLLVRKHPEVIRKGKTVDMSDIASDPVVKFQRKFYMVLMPICCFLLPTAVPYYLWNENIWVAWYVVGIFRYTASLHGTWLVNSAAHIYGTRSYDKSIKPTENKYVSSIAFGEGWHNYHHVFPWDYKASELGYHINSTTSFIDWFARLGWAYDLKTVPLDMVNRRAKRTGDGTRLNKSEANIDDGDEKAPVGIWGWGDTDMSQDHLLGAQISYKTE